MTKLRQTAAGFLLASATAWPTLMCMMADVVASPYERALAGAWCGAAPHANFEVLGHCPACWTGAAMLIATALMLMRSPSPGERIVAI